MINAMLNRWRQLSTRDLVIQLLQEQQQMRQDFLDAVARVDTAIGTIPNRTATLVAASAAAADTDGTEMVNGVTSLAGRVEAAVAGIGPVAAVQPPPVDTTNGGAGSDTLDGGASGQ